MRRCSPPFPDDFESWNNLGNVRAALGDLDGAVAAFQQAITLRPDIVEMVINLSEVLAARRAARGAPGGDARGGAGQPGRRPGCRPSSASPKRRCAISRRPSAPIARRSGSIRAALSAYLELGLLLENLNRIDELAALVDEAEARGLAGAGARLHPGLGAAPPGPVRGGAAARRGDARRSINPVRRAQLLAELHDRLGDADRAFAAFAEMNRAAVAAKPAPAGPTYRETVAADAALLTPERVAAWTGIEVARRRRRRRSSSSASRARARPCSTRC